MSATAAGLALAVAAGAAFDTAVDDGWQEAVISVSDLDAQTALFRDVLGFRVVQRGRVDRTQLAAWGLDRGIEAREVLLAQPGAGRGFVRLVAFSGPQDRGRIRSSAQPWEAGGWVGLNVRITDIAVTFRRLQRAGFQGFSDPVEFVVPPFRVREAMMAGPDGIVLGLLERVEPPLAGPAWESLVSRPVTAFATTAAPEETAALLERVGLRVRLSFDGPAAEPGPNLFALPHNVVATARRSVRWWQAAGREEGTIATIAFTGLEGRSHAAGAAPPALGLFTLRLPVSDVERRCAAAGASAAALVAAPYGPLRGCSIRLPDGAMLDLLGRP